MVPREEFVDVPAKKLSKFREVIKNIPQELKIRTSGDVSKTEETGGRGVYHG